jgi:hypothetical protein
MTSGEAHRQVDVPAERQRHKAGRRVAHAGEVVRTVVRVVRDDDAACPQSPFQQREHVRVQRLRAIEQYEVDRGRQVGAEIAAYADALADMLCAWRDTLAAR